MTWKLYNKRTVGGVTLIRIWKRDCTLSARNTKQAVRDHSLRPRWIRLRSSWPPKFNQSSSPSGASCVGRFVKIAVELWLTDGQTTRPTDDRITQLTNMLVVKYDLFSGFNDSSCSILVMWRWSTSENRLKIGVLHRGASVSAKFSLIRGRPPPIIFARIDRPYNFVADSFHTEKLCSRLASSKVRF